MSASSRKPSTNARPCSKGRSSLVRLTRDAEVEIDDDPGAGLRELVQEQVRQRRYEPVVRLEFGPGADPAIREMLRERFELSPADIYDIPEEVDYTPLFELAGLPIPELRDPAWTPFPHPSLPDEGTGIFTTVQAGDVLVHHPYDSFRRERGTLHQHRRR